MKTKRIVALFVILSVFLTACSSKFTLQKAIKEYQKYGVEVSEKQKPYYQMVGAKDGVMFYMGGYVVKLYEFASEADYQKGLKILKAMKKYPKKDLVVLDTDSKGAKEVFNKIK
jgi:hypothetical protein